MNARGRILTSFRNTDERLTRREIVERARLSDPSDITKVERADLLAKDWQPGKPNLYTLTTHGVEAQRLVR
jgi:hypothetical protein